MSAFGGKADVIVGKADIAPAPSWRDGQGRIDRGRPEPPSTGPTRLRATYTLPELRRREACFSGSGLVIETFDHIDLVDRI